MTSPFSRALLPGPGLIPSGVRNRMPDSVQAGEGESTKAYQRIRKTSGNMKDIIKKLPSMMEVFFRAHFLFRK